MKQLFKSKRLSYLQKETGKQLDSVGKLLNNLAPIEKQSSLSKILSWEERSLRAATIIKQHWLKKRFADTLIKNPYEVYLSLIGPTEDRQTAQFIFLRRQAERDKNGNKALNPFIQKDPFYHREDKHDGELFDLLLTQFGIKEEDKKNNHYVFITDLSMFSSKEILQHFPKEMREHIVEFSDKNKTIKLLQLSQQFGVKGFKKLISALGVVASPWEMAINLDKANLACNEIQEIPFADGLPTSKQVLLDSEIMQNLCCIAGHRRYPTQKLASGLKKLLNNLPELTSAEIQRVALMLDLSNRYYPYHYSHYAFFVYIIIHEISMSLVRQTEVEKIALYDKFIASSSNTFYSMLGLDKEELDKNDFFDLSLLSASGTNAYSIAQLLASQMKTDDSSNPTINVLEPSYYEFAQTTKNSNLNDADIYCISAGSICCEHAIEPGIDINRLLRRLFIEEKRKKPLMLIIDATTALNKNLKLEKDVKTLIKQGSVSLIIHQSLQKFGLFHSDQAQGGKIVALFSMKQFSKEHLLLFIALFKEDFLKHVDLRIVALIDSTCGPILEDIKERHFHNGDLLKKLFKPSLPSLDVFNSTVDSLPTNKDLYFVPFPNEKFAQLKRYIEERDSFGHYNITRVQIPPFYCRISHHASDDLDCLIKNAQLYISAYYSKEEIKTLLVKLGKMEESPELVDQIVMFGMLRHVKDSFSKTSTPKELVLCYLTFRNMLDLFATFKGRKCHRSVEKNCFELRQLIIEQLHLKNFYHFISAIEELYKLDIARGKNSTLTDELFANEDVLNKVINWPKKSPLTDKKILILLGYTNTEKLLKITSCKNKEKDNESDNAVTLGKDRSKARNQFGLFASGSLGEEAYVKDTGPRKINRASHF